jgi:hypothetical protein
MTDNNLRATFVVALTMSVAAMLMAWIIFAIGIKGWAAVREKR